MYIDWLIISQSLLNTLINICSVLSFGELGLHLWAEKKIVAKPLPKVMAGQQTMPGQNGDLTDQKLHWPVLHVDPGCWPVMNTLILGQTAKSTPVNLDFGLFV